MTTHLDQWQHNRRFLETISPTYPDWAVTAAFYAALHSIDHLLEHDKAQPPNSHRDRLALIRTTNRYSKIWSHFVSFYGLSRTVRYMAAPSLWIPWSDIDNKVLQRMLYPIEQSVAKLTGLDTKALPKLSLRTSS